jgi:hypothetical protein
MTRDMIVRYLHAVAALQMREPWKAVEREKCDV